MGLPRVRFLTNANLMLDNGQEKMFISSKNYEVNRVDVYHDIAKDEKYADIIFSNGECVRGVTMIGVFEIHECLNINYFEIDSNIVNQAKEQSKTNQGST